MDLEAEPPWSKSQLRKLGEALLDHCAPPAGCPDYSTVMLWHNDLAGAVAEIITDRHWDAQGITEFAVTARSKTVDTLVQKLERSTLKLDRVQDLAGVRIDADLNLSRQTQLAEEIAAHFGSNRATIRDIREEPHSGYRAVHVWLALPAGRVEIQIRTIYQSLWANVYEGLGDLFGRGIRYDQIPGDPKVARIVEVMHGMSADIAHDETVADQLENVMDEWLNAYLDRTGGDAASMPGRPELIDQAIEILMSETTVDYVVRLRKTADYLRDLRRILES